MNPQEISLGVSTFGLSFDSYFDALVFAVISFHNHRMKRGEYLRLR
jgi:hypothetical protein